MFLRDVVMSTHLQALKKGPSKRRRLDGPFFSSSTHMDFERVLVNRLHVFIKRKSDLLQTGYIVNIEVRIH